MATIQNKHKETASPPPTATSLNKITITTDPTKSLEGTIFSRKPAMSRKPTLDFEHINFKTESGKKNPPHPPRKRAPGAQKNHLGLKKRKIIKNIERGRPRWRSWSRERKHSERWAFPSPIARSRKIFNPNPRAATPPLPCWKIYRWKMIDPIERLRKVKSGTEKKTYLDHQ